MALAFTHFLLLIVAISSACAIERECAGAYLLTSKVQLEGASE
jgi:hypothetical protein